MELQTLMRSEQALRNRIKKEEILRDSTMKKAMGHPIPEDRENVIDSALRECVKINERIMALRWVLGEVSEL
jgi:hypothetical protein